MSEFTALTFAYGQGRLVDSIDLVQYCKLLSQSNWQLHHIGSPYTSPRDIKTLFPSAFVKSHSH